MTHDHYKGHKSLADMILGHLEPFLAALEAERDSKLDVLDHDEAAYWDREIAALHDIAAAVQLDYHPRDMITAPTDGTRVLVQAEVQHHVAVNPNKPSGFKTWKPVGTKWVEASWSTDSLNPLQWKPLP